MLVFKAPELRFGSPFSVPFSYREQFVHDLST